jgi:putative transposase
MNTIALTRLLPQLLKTHNGFEFAGKCWTSWCMKGGPYRLFQAGNTEGQCHSGVVQWQSATGMTEQGLVHVSGGCTVQNRGLVHTL